MNVESRRGIEACKKPQIQSRLPWFMVVVNLRDVSYFLWKSKIVSLAKNARSLSPQSTLAILRTKCILDDRLMGTVETILEKITNPE